MSKIMIYFGECIFFEVISNPVKFYLFQDLLEKPNRILFKFLMHFRKKNLYVFTFSTIPLYKIKI